MASEERRSALCDLVFCWPGLQWFLDLPLSISRESQVVRQCGETNSVFVIPEIGEGQECVCMCVC